MFELNVAIDKTSTIQGEEMPVFWFCLSHPTFTNKRGWNWRSGCL